MIHNLFSRLRRTGSRTESSNPAIRQEIEALERQAISAPLNQQGSLYNRAGDLCVKEGEYARSLVNFGQAIDAYLRQGHLDTAPALCRKVIRLAPEVVRARSTLAAISLAEGLFTDAERQISDYVLAAEAAEQERLAVERLRLLATATESHHVRMQVAEYLIELGSPAVADQVFGMVFAERNGLRQRLSAETDERWGRLLPVALLGPREIVELDRSYRLT